MDLPQPITREELYLAYYVGLRGFALPSEPATRIELYLAKLCGKQSVQLPSRPVTNAEIYLAKLCGEDVQLPAEPILRVDFYLAKLCGEDVQLPPEPYTKTEAYLAFAATTEVSEVVISGEMSTIEDTLEGIGFSEVQLLGDSFQQTYTGKNLWGGFASDVPYTSGGITWSNKKDGTIEVDTGGTTTATSNSLNAATARNNNHYLTLAAGTYCVSGGSGIYEMQAVRASDGNLLAPIGGVLSFTLASTTDVFVRARVLGGEEVGAGTVLRPQLELGSIRTSYEPYVGSIPAPNPDYPQDVNVVTGEQAVKVTGKNLFDKSNNSHIINGFLNGTALSIASSATSSTVYIPCQPNTTYTVSKIAGERFAIGTTTSTPEVGTGLLQYSREDGATKLTITTGDAAKYLVVWPYNSNVDTGTLEEMLSTVQIELGSTTSDYVPYQGQSYPLSLGTLELAKIGDYQDYLWTDGEKWYKHKALEKMILDGTETQNGGWQVRDTGTVNYYYRLVTDGQTKPLNVNAALMTHFAWAVPRIGNDNTSQGFSVLNGTTANWHVRIRWGTEKTLTDFKTWLGALRPTLYWVPESATDEVITDETLISQLNALADAYGYAGQTNFFIVAEDPNLPAGLKLKVRRAA